MTSSEISKIVGRAPEPSAHGESWQHRACRSVELVREDGGAALYIRGHRGTSIRSASMLRVVLRIVGWQ